MTLETVARSLGELTYTEMMDLAKYISDASGDWRKDGIDADASYFANLLIGWATDQEDEDNEQEASWELEA